MLADLHAKKLSDIHDHIPYSRNDETRRASHLEIESNQE